MNGFRYVLAVLLAVSMPPAVAYWYVIHPFAHLWRRLGPKLAFAILWLGFLAAIWGCWLARHTLLGRDLGTNPWLIPPGLALYILALWISEQVRRHLSLRILVGWPELASGHGPGKLLNEGIYARVRHPRYAAYLIGCLGAAMIVNYAGIWILTALLFPALHLVTVIEERELRQRFGAQYDAYAAAVPRLIPRIGRGA